MTYDIKELKLPLQKVIELGAIDRWLRGVANIVPASTAPAPRAAADKLAPDFNAHSLNINRTSLVMTEDIERMVGFRQLLTAASHNNVRLDVTTVEGLSLSIAFSPAESFSHSHVFDKSFSNVRPAIFGRRASLKA